MSNPHQELWDNLGDEEYIRRYMEQQGTKTATPKPKTRKMISVEILEDYIEYSNRTIEEAKLEMEQAISQERYFRANEMRVLISFHQNNIQRLKYMVEGTNPFR